MVVKSRDKFLGKDLQVEMREGQGLLDKEL